MSIISDMKPLILIVAASISLGAQTIADAARQERTRQAQVKSTRVFTDANAHSVDPAIPVAIMPGRLPIPAPAAPATAAKPAVVVPPSDDPVQKLRARIRDLEDQETALKLKINDVSIEFYNPVTDMAARNDAQARLVDAQVRLGDTQRELAQTRTTLQQKEAEAQAAPKK